MSWVKEVVITGVEVERMECGMLTERVWQVRESGSSSMSERRIWPSTGDVPPSGRLRLFQVHVHSLKMAVYMYVSPEAGHLNGLAL